MIKNIGYKIHYTRGLDLASASTLPVDGTGDYFHVTGTTNITRIAERGKGMQIVLEFEDVLTVSHDSTYLILDRSEDIVTSAGMTLRFVEYDTGGKWKLIGGTGSESGYFSSSGTSATLGDQLDNNGDFTTDLTGWSGTNWAWSATDGGSAQHTTGSTSALTGVAPGLVLGNAYYGVVEIAGRTAGYVEFQIGIYPIPFSEGVTRYEENGVYEGGLVCYETGDATVTITPSSDFDGRINYIRFYEITSALPAITVYDEDSEDAIDIYGDYDNSNVFIGNNSGFNSYNGTGNTYLGHNAGIGSVTGDDNTFIGANAGQICAIGNDNTAIGKDAGAGLVTGIANTLVGKDAGKDISIGYGNVCVGTGAGESMLSSANSTFIGKDSGSTTTSANNNTGVGHNTLKALTDGSASVAVGNSALTAVTEGLGNTGLGYIAGTAITTGDYNTAVGNQAGKDITTGTGNTSIGSGAGIGGTTMSSSIHIGYNAVPSAAGVTNEILLGTGTGPGSNKMTLGNDNITDTTIYGETSFPDGISISTINGEVSFPDGISVSTINGPTDFPDGLSIDTLTGITTLGAATANLTTIGGTTATISTVNCTTLNTSNISSNNITFPATQSPSPGANTLDDYEEGTFTPVLTANGSGASFTYTLNQGVYVKIGKLVHFRLVIVVASVSSGSGADTLTINLPFATPNTYGASDRFFFAIRTNDVYANSTPPQLWVGPNTANMNIGYYNYSSGWTGFTQNNSNGVKAGSEICITGAYEV